MKRRFKTNKILTAVNETKHTVTTSEGKIIHKKLASKPIKFQLSKKPEEKRKPTNRCVRCGKFSQGDYCDTHKRVYGVPKDTDEPGCSYALPTMPEKRSTYGDVIVTDTESDSTKKQDEPAEKSESRTNTTTTAAETHPNEEENTPEVNTPPPSTPVQCSTSYGTHPTQPEGELQTPVRATVSAEITPKKEQQAQEAQGNLKTIKKTTKKYKMPIESSADLRRSNRIKDAKRTVTLGGVE